MKKYKLVFTVPVADAEKVRQAIGEVGGGKIGKYSFCSFSVRGVGRFKPEPGADPAIGVVGKLEEVEEEKVEVVCDAHVIDACIAAMKKAHPYEEVAYDVYVLEEK
jgi:hypothetical protein